MVTERLCDVLPDVIKILTRWSRDCTTLENRDAEACVCDKRPNFATSDASAPLLSGAIVAEVPGKGRGLLATDDLEAGRVILTEAAVGAVPLVSRMCYHCLSGVAVDPVYSKCVQALVEASCSPPEQLAAQIAVGSVGAFSTVSKLCDHRDSLEDIILCEMCVKASLLANLLGSDDSAQYSADLAHAIFLLLLCIPPNAVAVTRTGAQAGSSGQTETVVCERVALAVFPLASMVSAAVALSPHPPPLIRIMCQINHDCSPNAIFRFKFTASPATALRGLKVEVVLVSAVRAGEEIRISYGPIATTEPDTAARQRALLHFYFRCSCQSCVSPAAGGTLAHSGELSEFKATELGCPRCGDRSSGISRFVERSTVTTSSGAVVYGRCRKCGDLGDDLRACLRSLASEAAEDQVISVRQTCLTPPLVVIVCM